MNALKQGLTAEVKFLPGESQEAYDRLLIGYLEHLQPAGTCE